MPSIIARNVPGMLHFGVVKALAEANLLPPVICGASIGALVAALLGLLLIRTYIQQKLMVYATHFSDTQRR